MSLAVSRRRRRLPHSSARMTPGIARICSSSAWPSGSARSMRTRLPTWPRKAIPSRIFCLRLRAEALELGDLARARTRPSASSMVSMPRLSWSAFTFFGPIARQAEHLDQPRGDRGPQLLEVRQLAGGDERGDLLLERLADAADLAELPVGDELLQVAGELLDGAGGRCGRRWRGMRSRPEFTRSVPISSRAAATSSFDMENLPRVAAEEDSRRRGRRVMWVIPFGRGRLSVGVPEFEESRGPARSVHQRWVTRRAIVAAGERAKGGCVHERRYGCRDWAGWEFHRGVWRRGEAVYPGGDTGAILAGAG